MYCYWHYKVYAFLLKFWNTNKVLTTLDTSICARPSTIKCISKGSCCRCNILRKAPYIFCKLRWKLYNQKQYFENAILFNRQIFFMIAFILFEIIPIRLSWEYCSFIGFSRHFLIRSYNSEADSDSMHYHKVL